MHLTLLTINVWSGLTYSGLTRVGSMETEVTRRARYQELLEGVHALDADVVAVNEANPVAGFMRRFADDLGYDEIHHPGLCGVRMGPFGLPTNLCEGDGVLCRRDLGLRYVARGRLSGGLVARHWSVNFSNATQIVCGRLTSGLHVLCTHWSVAVSARDYERQKGCRDSAADADGAASARRVHEAERTIAFASRWVPRGAPAVLLGDLNAPPEAPEIALLRSAGWIDAWSSVRGSDGGATWDEGRNPRIRDHYPAARADVAQRLDYVWVNGALGAGSVLSADVVLDGSNGRPPPSDHFGLAVRIVCD